MSKGEREINLEKGIERGEKEKEFEINFLIQKVYMVHKIGGSDLTLKKE